MSYSGLRIVVCYAAWTKVCVCNLDATHDCSSTGHRFAGGDRRQSISLIAGCHQSYPSVVPWKTSQKGFATQSRLRPMMVPSAVQLIRSITAGYFLTNAMGSKVSFSSEGRPGVLHRGSIVNPYVKSLLVVVICMPCRSDISNSSRSFWLWIIKKCITCTEKLHEFDEEEKL